VALTGWLAGWEKKQHQVAPTSRSKGEGGRIALSFNYRGRWDVTGSTLSVALAEGDLQ
jgi:hypothetical protein